MRRKVLVLFTLALFLSTAQAQTQSSTMTGFRRNFAIVAFAGIGGAVLGLSTLSFYGSPQDHVGNITTGFLLGLVGGGVYVAANASAPPSRTSSESYSLIDRPQAPLLAKATIMLPIYVADF